MGHLNNNFTSRKISLKLKMIFYVLINLRTRPKNDETFALPRMHCLVLQLSEKCVFSIECTIGMVEGDLK